MLQPEMNQQFNVPKGASLLLEFNLVIFLSCIFVKSVFDVKVYVYHQTCLMYIGGTFQVVQGLGHPGFLSFFLRLDPGFNIYVGNIKVQMFISWSLSLIQCNAMLCLVQKLRELEV